MFYVLGEQNIHIYIHTKKGIKLLFYLFSIYLNKLRKKLYICFYFIGNENSIPHFKIAPLDYSCTSGYLQKCKAAGNPTLLSTSSGCLKVGMSQISECDLDL